MNCFEFRRVLLVNPRERTAEQEAHLAQCAACARLAVDAGGFETRLEQAVLVPVPDGLADRILLRHKMQPGPRYRLLALAATLVLGVGVATQLYRTNDAAHEPARLAVALGAEHPAVAAISFVIDHEPRLLSEGRTGDPQVMMASLKRLGLNLPAGGVAVRYLGKCPLPGGGMGDHVVLTTSYGQVTLILAPDYPVGSRVLVADRSMTALAQPSGTGGYIVIAHSAETVRGAERLLKS
jgi:hypothetical protein